MAKCIICGKSSKQFGKNHFIDLAKHSKTHSDTINYIYNELGKNLGDIKLICKGDFLKIKRQISKSDTTKGKTAFLDFDNDLNLDYEMWTGNDNLFYHFF